MIYRVIDHYSNSGAHIQEYVLEHGEPPADFPRYRAVGIITVKHGNYDVPRNYVVDIDANDIIEAFEKAADALKEGEDEAIKMASEEMAEN